MGWPHHRGLHPPLFLTSGGGSFTSHKNQINESALRRDLQFFVLIREGSLNICRCNYKGSTFFSIIQRPWALVRPGFKPVTSCSADRHSSNWANQAAVLGDEFWPRDLSANKRRGSVTKLSHSAIGNYQTCPTNSLKMEICNHIIGTCIKLFKNPEPHKTAREFGIWAS